MRQYETIYLLKADLPPDQLTEIKEKFTKNLSGGSSHILSQGDWGKRKLAYDIEKNRYAHYIYLRYLTTGDVVHNLERLLKIEDSVLKFLTVRLDEVENVEELLGQDTQDTAAPEEVVGARADSGPPRRGRDSRGSEGGRPDRRGSDSRGSDSNASESKASETKAPESKAAEAKSEKVKPKDAPSEAKPSEEKKEADSSGEESKS